MPDHPATPTGPHAVLDELGFSEPVRTWFATTFAEPTPAQSRGWPAIASGEHSLILAPTGSGKTLAAFLWTLDQLTREPPPDDDRRLRVVYVSPLRALAVDIDRNLRAPLRGVALAGERLGVDVHAPEVAIRTGDTPADKRRRIQRHPPDILITTPESLFLMLTSKVRERFASVDTVIIDEIHAVAGTKRGAHLALSLERLEELTDRPPQRIGLSATQKPLDEIARFLGGSRWIEDDRLEARPVTIVDAGVSKELDVEVVVPLQDMGDLGSVIPDTDGPAASGPTRKSIWPAIHPRLLELVKQHRSTLVFVNARRLAERLAARLNELALESDDEESAALAGLVAAHHGSLSRERRTDIEDQLKAGHLRALVATSSLELGIDMGAVDLVVQVASPGSVARGLQRIGRAGHQVGEPSRGKLFPKYRGDLVETAVVVQRMLDGQIEATRYPRNPLDVLAQHVVAMAAMDEWTVDDLARVVRRAANFTELTDEVLHAVLDLLAGRYPSEEFSELRPRIVWDRIGRIVRGRPGAQRLAVTNPGTIPDRGLFGVFLPDGTRVGELDEEMVHESRPGETFILGASTWRIEDITHERVVVTPAPGEPGKLPFWHGDGPGRPYELGRAIGAFVREVRAAPRDEALATLQRHHGLDPWAAGNLLDYLDEQAEVTGSVPDDRTVLVERFRDEIGDWRVCIHSPHGAQVHAPWAMAIEAQLLRAGLDAEILWSDDGIVLRLQEAVEELPLELLQTDPDEVEPLVVGQLAGTALFTTVFREAAGRALLLPKRRPGERTALWQQRQRAANLLKVAAAYPQFPITLEATRECLQDVFDLPALKELLTDLRSRRVRLVAVDTEHASPFAQSLLFSWVGTYMYEYDAPLAERRAAALALDRDLLRELLGGEELRELLDADVLDQLELELQHLTDDRRARNADELADLLRVLGDLTPAELAVRSASDPTAWIDQLVTERRAIRIRVADEDRVAAAEDAARYRDALGVALPPGLPAAFTEPVDLPLDQLVGRYARTHGPFLTRQLVARLGVPVERVRPVLARLQEADRIVQGEFRPGGVEREWCDVDVLRRLRRRSLAALRREIEPVDAEAYGRFLPAWHGLDRRRRGPDALYETVGRLEGAAIPASVLERDVLSARVADYREADLDQLCATGEIVWIGAGSLGADDGRIVLAYRDQAPLLGPLLATDDVPDGPLHAVIRDHLDDRGASFWADLLAAAGPVDPTEVLEALWDLVWAGEVTNDTLVPVRARRRRRRPRRSRPRRPRRAAPAPASGRWSLVAPLLQPEPTSTEVAHALASRLLDRYGVVTREAVRAEGTPGGFAGVYPVLRALEEAGQLRRGYFVAGLGAAQFAVPGAVDRLRGERDADPGDCLALAATDPAQPYGAALPWPDRPEDAGRPSRSAGAYVVLDGGAPAAFLERGARSLLTYGAVERGERWADTLATLVKEGRLRRIALSRIDGDEPHRSPVTDTLRRVGFTDSPQGLTYRG
ncbi:MAG: DEAD/DEAH box helicase [Actinobacteria bacterium]|nr:DEAD/DEAH box helicase [Actinomycetota bacterium]